VCRTKLHIIDKNAESISGIPSAYRFCLKRKREREFVLFLRGYDGFDICFLVVLSISGEDNYADGYADVAC